MSRGCLIGGLLIAAAGSAFGAAYDSEALGGVDLSCSACTLFVEEFHKNCAKTVFKAPESAQKVYKQRLQKIWKDKEVSQNTQKRLLAELANAPGKAQALYMKQCKRHGITPEPEPSSGAPAAGGDDVERKQELAEEALEKAVASVEAGGSVQWAMMGEEGKRQFIDFNKAMQGGSMSNLQMGGHVQEQLHGAFSALAEEHGSTLTSAIAESARLYDAKLHKTFCMEVGACKRKGDAADRDEL